MSLTSQKRTFRFRGPSSSESYNRMVEERYYDLVRLFEREGANRSKLSELAKIYAHETAVLSDWISGLDLGLQGATVLALYGPSTSGLGYVPPDGKAISKIYLGSADDPLLPSSLSEPGTAPLTYESTLEVITPEVAEGLTPVDVDWLGALHPARDRWTYREVESNASSLYFSIHLKLPRAVVNHFRVNAIRLDPLIPGSLTLHGIWYRQADQEWLLLPTVPTDATGKVEPFEKLVPTYIFSPVLDINELFLAFEQTYSKDGIFPYGFRHIGVEYWPYGPDYDYETGEPYELEPLTVRAPEGKYFDTVMVEPIWHPWAPRDAELLGPVMLDVNGIEQDPGEILQPSVNTVAVKARLYTTQGGTPALRGFRVTYTTL